MALSIQIPYRGDQYLFQGISGAASNLGQGIEQMAQRLKEAKAMRTMAVDGLGMDKEDVDRMSASEVRGHLQGAALKQHFSDLRQHSDEVAAQIDMHRQQIEAAKQRAAEHEALTGFARSYAAPGPQPSWRAPGFSDLQQAAGGRLPGDLPSMLPQQPPPMTADERTLRALGQYPQAAASEQFDNTLSALGKAMGPGGGGAVVPWTMPGPGGTMSGGLETHTGRIFNDIATEAAIAKARASGKTGPLQKQNTPTIPDGGSLEPATDAKGKDVLGLYHVLDKDGKRVSMWFNPHAPAHGAMQQFIEALGAGKTGGSATDPLGIMK